MESLPIRVAPPPPKLSPFVDNIWAVDIVMNAESSLAMRHAEVPNGNVMLMFNFGKPHRTYDDFDTPRHNTYKRCWLSGVHEGRLVIGPTEGTHMMGVQFKPGGMYPFIQVAAEAFTNEVVEMEQMWQREAEVLCEQLEEAQTFAGRYRLVANWLWQRACGDAQLDDRVAYCIRRITADQPSSIGEILDDIGISQRHLNRLFKQQVGVNPKRLWQLQRFNRVIKTIQLQRYGSRIDWSALAMQCGYYDQAHFNAEFKRFSGMTPTQLVADTQRILGLADVPDELIDRLARGETITDFS